MVPDDLTAAWQRVTEQWDDTTRHETFFALAARHNCFAWAAGRYRERSGDALADKQLDRIRRSVTATMMATATARPEPKSPYHNVVVALVCLVAVVVLGLFFTKLLHDTQPDSPRITKPASNPGPH